MPDADNPPEREMPRYKSHKVVHALKIGSLIYDSGDVTMCPDEVGYESIRLSLEYVDKHDPHPGGYYVVYEDGYKSFSPAKAFEEGYTRLE